MSDSAWKDVGDGKPVKVKKCSLCGIAPANVDDCGEFGNPKCPCFGIKKDNIMTTELKPCPFCGATEDEIMIMADWEEATDNSGNSRRIQCAACNIEAPFYPNKNEAIEAWNARAVPDVPELVRYGISMFGNGAVEMGEGEYVRYDQVAGMLAEERQSAEAAEADKKRLREALTKISKGSYDGLEVANLSKKHMKDIARAALEGNKK